MDIKKSIQLTTAPLEELLRASEFIDFRLDQDTWKELGEGDHIEFWEDFTGWQTEPAKDSRRVIAQIKKIYRAPTFTQLFNLIEKDMTRLGDKTALLSGLRSWWSEEREEKEGALAFYVVKV